jgi:hypothetical protein
MPRTTDKTPTCRRRHALTSDNIRTEKRYHFPKLSDGRRSKKRTTYYVDVCRKCVRATARARRAGKPLKDLRKGER